MTTKILIIPLLGCISIFIFALLIPIFSIRDLTNTELIIISSTDIILALFIIRGLIK